MKYETIYELRNAGKEAAIDDDGDLYINGNDGETFAYIKLQPFRGHGSSRWG